MNPQLKKSKKSNDVSKTSGNSPTGTTAMSTPGHKSVNSGNQPWFVVDKEGLRKTLSRMGKAVAIIADFNGAKDPNVGDKVEFELAPSRAPGKPDGAVKVTPVKAGA